MSHTLRYVLLWLLCVTPAMAQVQPWPAKPVRIYVGFPPGSSTDVVARIVANAVSPRIGQPIIVENRPGASGIIAATLAAKAAPDGYSLVVGTPTTHTTAPYVFLNLPYDPSKDFTPVALIGNSYYVLVVAPQTGVKSVKELVALALSRPGQLNYASVGEGSLAHLGALIFLEKTGIQATHVPYKGSAQSILDVVAGRIQFVFTVISTAQPLHRDGRVRIIAVAGPRQALLPDVPTMAESGYPDYELPVWYAAFMPAATPRAIVSDMNREMNAAVKDPKTSRLLVDAGVTPEVMTLEALRELMRKHAERFRRIVVKAGIKPQPL